MGPCFFKCEIEQEILCGINSLFAGTQNLPLTCRCQRWGIKLPSFGGISI